MIRVLLLVLAIILVSAGDATAQFSSIGGGGGGSVNYCVPTTCTGGQVVTSCPGPGQPFTCGNAASSGVVSNSATANPVARYAGAGQTVSASAVISDDGTNAYFSGPIDFKSFPAGTEIANEGVTGTTVNKIAKLTGAPSTAIITATTDVNGAAGIVVSGAGITLKALIAVTGQVNCIFDGATVAGHYVTISGSTAGDCHDAGASLPIPPAQVLGQVLATGAGGSTAVMLAVASSSGAAGSVTSVNTTVPAALLTGSGCNITTSGTCALSLANQTQNLPFLSPNGSSGTPTFRSFIAADFPANVLPYSKIQQVSAGLRLLGNNTAAAGNMLEIPLAARLRFNLGSLDVATSSIDSTFLAASAAATNVGTLGGDQGGTLPNPTNLKVNGVSYPAAPAAHQFPVITSAANGGTATYKTITNCPNTVGTGNHWNYDTSTDTMSCGTDNGVSLTALPGIKISPSPYNSGPGTIGPNWPINQTCKTSNYTIVEADSATSICMNGSSLTLAVNSSAANYLPAGEAFTVTNLNASNLTVCIGTAGACSGGGSSIFNNSPGTTTSFTLAKGAWAIIQSDGAGSPNNYWVYPSGAGGGGGTSGALVLISTQTASSSSSLDFTGLTNTYNHLFLTCDNLIQVATSETLSLRFGTGSTVWQTASYAWRDNTIADGSTTTTGSNNSSDGQMVLSAVNDVSNDATFGQTSFSADIYGAMNTAVLVRVIFQTTNASVAAFANLAETRGVAYWFGGTSTTGIRVFFQNAGTVSNITSGKCSLYGFTP